MIRDPLSCLRAVEAQYPDVWMLVEHFHNSRGIDIPAWPEWCFLPLAGWYAIINAGGDCPPLSLMQEVSCLAAIGSWRYTQSIYHFDADTARLVIRGAVPDMNTERFMLLPESSLYIKTEEQYWRGEALYGFWAHLECDARTQQRELRLLLNTASDLVPFTLLLGPWSVSDALARLVYAAEGQATQHGLQREFNEATTALPIAELKRSIEPLLSLLAHLSGKPCLEPVEQNKPGEVLRTAFVQHPQSHGHSPLQVPDQVRHWRVSLAFGATG